MSWENVEKAKDYLVKKEGCKDFFEYSLKYGLIEDITVPRLFFGTRVVGQRRKVVETFNHIFRAMKEMGIDIDD